MRTGTWSWVRHARSVGVGLAAAAWLWALPVAAQSTTTLPRESAQAAPAVADTSAAAGVPVVMGGDTLFRLTARLGPFSAQVRARSIEQRLEALVRQGAANVRVVAGTGSSDIMAGDSVIMSVTDADAALAHQPRHELAAAYAAEIHQALAERSAAFSLKAILLGVLYTVLATIALVLVLRMFAQVFPRAYAVVHGWRETRIPSIRIQRLELLSAARITRGLILLLRVLRVAVTVLVLYFYMPLVLGFFPWTQTLSSRLVEYVWGPIASGGLAIVNYLPKLLTIAVIVVGTYYLLKLIRMLFDAIGSGSITFESFYPDWAEPTYKIIRFLVSAFAVILIWPYLPQSDSMGFKGVAAFLGLLVTFGSATAVANIFGGVIMVYMRPFQIGDRVRIADTEGDVVEKNLLVTRVRTIKNVDVTVPNALVLGSHIINYSSTAKEGGVILHTGVTIGYDAPWRDVHAALLEAAKRTDGLLQDPSPFVLQTALDDFYVHYEINAHTMEARRMATIYSELHRNIQDTFGEAGIEIMSSHYASIRDGNTTTMPVEHRPKGYEAPAFRVIRRMVEPKGDVEHG